MRKITAFILSMVIIAGTIAVRADENTDNKYEKTLFSLGICDLSDSDEFVSRGEFTKMALKLLSIDTVDYSNDDGIYFVDLDKDNIYYNEIITAYNRGIIKGYSKEYFAADEKISMEQCVKVLLSAMNYTDIAASRGGFPMGYTSIAEEIGLLKGIENIAEPKRSDIYRLLYNALSVPLAVVSVDGDNVSYTYSDKGNTLLSSKNIEIKEGVITACGLFSAYVTSTNAFENQIELDHVSYNCNVSFDADELLGMRAKVYFDKDNEEITAIELSKKNQRVKVDFDCFEKCADGVIYYEENGRSKKAYVKSNAGVLINNSYLGNLDLALNLKSFDDFESLYLTDNDGDGKTDFINIEKYSYELVETAYPNDSEIVFANDRGSIKFDDDDITELVKDEMAFSLAMLAENDTLMIKKSELVSGRKYYKIIVSRNEIKGKVEEIREEDNKKYFTVDGEEYELCSEYKKELEKEDYEYKISVSNFIAAYISADNKIVFAENESQYSYGYLMKLVEDETEEQFYARIYTMNKEEKELTFADKITLYSDESEYLWGKRVKKEDAFRYLNAEKNYRYGMVMFSENDSGYLETLVLPKNVSDKAPGSDPYPLCENVSAVSGGEWSIGYSYFGVLAHKYRVNSSKVLILYAPDKAENKADKEQYNVKKGGSLPQSYAFSKGSVLKLYNVDKLYKPDVILNESSDGVSADVDTEAFAAVVDKVSYEIDSADETKLKLSYYQAGTKKEAFFADNAMAADSKGWYGCGSKSVDDIKKGDILLLGIDMNNNIRSYRILFKENDRGKYRVEGGDNAFGTLTITYGKCSEKGDTAVIMDVNGDIYPAQLTGFYDLKKYYTLIERKGPSKVTVSPVTQSDLRKGDEVVARKRWNEAVEFFIFR